MSKNNLQPWFVYIVRCSDQTLYTGISNNLPERLKKHDAGLGAAYTRGRGPVALLYSESCADRSSASKREWEIKQLSRSEKEQLIESLIS